MMTLQRLPQFVYSQFPNSSKARTAGDHHLKSGQTSNFALCVRSVYLTIECNVAPAFRTDEYA
jgi:hypothetical protein